MQEALNKLRTNTYEVQNAKIIIIYLLQCNLTEKVGRVVKPRDISLDYVKQLIEMLTEEIRNINPSAGLVWTLPPVANFKLYADATTAAQWQDQIAGTITSLRNYLQNNNYYYLDLAACMSRRWDGITKETLSADGVHPTPRAVRDHLSHVRNLVHQTPLRKLLPKLK